MRMRYILFPMRPETAQMAIKRLDKLKTLHHLKKPLLHFGGQNENENEADKKLMRTRLYDGNCGRPWN